MEITIGVQNTPRELTVRTDKSAADIAKLVEAAMKGTTLDLVDERGRHVIVPTSSLAYVEIGPEDVRRVGFTG